MVDIKCYMIYKKKKLTWIIGLEFTQLCQSNFHDRNQVIYVVTSTNKELDGVIFFNGRGQWLQWSMLITSVPFVIKSRLPSHMHITSF